MRRRIPGLKVEEGKNNRSIVLVAAKTLKATSVDISPVENTKKNDQKCGLFAGKRMSGEELRPAVFNAKNTTSLMATTSSSDRFEPIAIASGSTVVQQQQQQIDNYICIKLYRATRQSVIAISVENGKTQVRLIGSSLTSSSRSLFSGSTGCPITDGFYTYFLVGDLNNFSFVKTSR